jgi:hypothetical protein
MKKRIMIYTLALTVFSAEAVGSFIQDQRSTENAKRERPALPPKPALIDSLSFKNKETPPPLLLKDVPKRFQILVDGKYVDIRTTNVQPIATPRSNSTKKTPPGPLKPKPIRPSTITENIKSPKPALAPRNSSENIESPIPTPRKSSIKKPTEESTGGLQKALNEYKQQITKTTETARTETATAREQETATAREQEQESKLTFFQKRAMLDNLPLKKPKSKAEEAAEKAEKAKAKRLEQERLEQTTKKFNEDGDESNFGFPDEDPKTPVTPAPEFIDGVIPPPPPAPPAPTGPGLPTYNNKASTKNPTTQQQTNLLDQIRSKRKEETPTNESLGTRTDTSTATESHNPDQQEVILPKKPKLPEKGFGFDPNQISNVKLTPSRVRPQRELTPEQKAKREEIEALMREREMQKKKK